VLEDDMSLKENSERRVCQRFGSGAQRGHSWMD
jgi:hypothetical protein